MTALIAGAVAGVSAVVGSATAGAISAGHAAPAAAPAPVPMAGGQYAGSLILNDSGSALKSWDKSKSYCTVSPDYVANGVIGTSSSGAATLTTTSTPGSCVALVSPGAYSSGVIEASMYFPALPGKPGTIANWTGIWLTGPSWPSDGELDAVEVEPVDATNAVTWHSGTSSALFTASTSIYFQPRLPMQTANITPGWHMVDMVYNKGFFAVYYDGKLYTSYTSSNVTGRPLNIYVTMVNTPDTSWVHQHIGGAPINSANAPATLQVKDLRVWSYK